MNNSNIQQQLKKVSQEYIKELETNGLTGKLEDIKRRESKLKAQLSSCN